MRHCCLKAVGIVLVATVNDRLKLRTANFRKGLMHIAERHHGGHPVRRQVDSRSIGASWFLDREDAENHRQSQNCRNHKYHLVLGYIRPVRVARYLARGTEITRYISAISGNPLGFKKRYISLVGSL